ncbi:MAG: hypothetical protein ACM3N5_05055 [Candidatus Eiseniibacteriota bacterium]
MKVILCAVAALVLAGCTNAATRGDATEVVSGDANNVSVRAARGVDPTPTAEAHCEKYGKEAVRRLITPIPDQQEPGMTVYVFACA